MLIDEISIRALLPLVSVPTLVFHADRDRVIPAEEGRILAAEIPGARFVSLSTRNHILRARNQRGAYSWKNSERSYDGITFRHPRTWKAKSRRSTRSAVARAAPLRRLLFADGLRNQAMSQASESTVKMVPSV